MRLNFDHPTEDELEKYLLGHLAGSETEAVEEHLLVCEPCQSVLQAEEVIVLAMRSACHELVHERAPALRRWWRLPIPVPVYAGVFAVFLALLPLGYLYRGPAIVPESELALTATRSAGVLHSPFAAAGSTVMLHLDATALPSPGHYGVEVVGAAGNRIWSGVADSAASVVTVRVAKRLQAGRYWVRLNQPDGEELREYELNVH